MSLSPFSQHNLSISKVAAFACCRTDDELRTLLVPELADKIQACEDGFMTWSKRAWKTGARFDPVDWAKKACWFTLGSMTFREAFERTGRVLNVSVIVSLSSLWCVNMEGFWADISFGSVCCVQPFETHSPTKLLNYLTAPDCIIFTACIASAAVPGILPPVVLLSAFPFQTSYLLTKADSRCILGQRKRMEISFPGNIKEDIKMALCGWTSLCKACIYFSTAISPSSPKLIPISVYSCM